MVQIAQHALIPDYLATQRANPNDVTFTPAQFKALESLFPEVAQGADYLTEAQVRHHLGQRSVIAFIRDRTKGT